MTSADAPSIDTQGLRKPPRPAGRHAPPGNHAVDAAQNRSKRSEAYREAQDEYAAIRELRKKNWIAAHIRERRFELDLTQKDIAERAGSMRSC